MSKKRKGKKKSQRRTLDIHEKLEPVFLRLKQEHTTFFDRQLVPALKDLKNTAGKKPDQPLGEGFYGRSLHGAWLIYHLNPNIVQVVDFEFVEQA